MKKIILLFLFQAFCAAGFAENLWLKEPLATHIPARADLDVRWNAPTNKTPADVWVYHVLPRPLSPQAMSNLLVACSFTNETITNYEGTLVLRSSDSRRSLLVDPQAGRIEYFVDLPLSPTNLVKNVPSKRQAIKLAEKFMKQIDINPSEVWKKENSSEPDYYVFEQKRTYFVNRKPIYNNEGWEVRFRRAVDGISFAGAGGGGYFSTYFGGHGKIYQINITWRNVKRDKSYPIVSPERIIRFIREGKAIQGIVPDTVGSIDWQTVKNVTIKNVKVSYYTGGNSDAPSNWLEPYAALWTTVDTGHGSIDVEIDSPIIDESEIR